MDSWFALGGDDNPGPPSCQAYRALGTLGQTHALLAPHGVDPGQCMRNRCTIQAHAGIRLQKARPAFGGTGGISFFLTQVDPGGSRQGMRR